MTPAVIGQKLDRLLQLCGAQLQKIDRIDRLLQHKTNHKQTKDKDAQPNGDGIASPQILGGNTNEEEGFWKKITISDRIQMSLAVLTFLAVGSGVWSNFQTRKLVKTAQKTYAASNRPYVGVESIGTSFQNVNSKGEEVIQTKPDETTNALGFSPMIKNFGTVPGENETAFQRVFLNGIQQKATKVLDKPSIIFPSQTISLMGHTGKKEYPEIRDGKTILHIDVHIEYDGPDEHYTYCQRYQYSPDNFRFMNLGPLCAN